MSPISGKTEKIRMKTTRFAALTGLIGIVATAAAAGSVYAAAKSGGDVREFTVGLSTDDLPQEGYLGFACGNNGAAPGTEIAGWHAFAECPADEKGLHEVAFQYDDTDVLFEDMEGTGIAGHPVLISLLFNQDGVVEALRVFTDPFARPYNKRRARVLGRKVKARFGVTGWTCEDLPREATEGEFGGIYTKERCVTDLGNRTVELTTRFYRTFEDGEEEIVNSTHFEVWRKPDTSS